MKNSKLLVYTISLIFTLSTLLACFPAMNAAASTITLSEDDYSNASLVISEIAPDFPLKDGEVTTRAEFVAAVAMMLNMPAKKMKTSSFTDVDPKSAYASYIEYARSLGLISNVALFYPDTPITYAQAIKIVMSAAGYGKKAEYQGGFPTGYLICANEAGIGKGTELGNDEVLSHELATKLIFEACCTDMMQASSYGSSYNYTVTEGKNILSSYHDIYIIEGIVEANENTGLYSQTSTSGKGYITVNGKNLKGEGFENLIGKRIRAFYNGNRQNSILFAYEAGNKIERYTSDDDIVVSGFKATVSSDTLTKDVTHNLNTSYTVIYNGKYLSSPDIASYIDIDAGSVEFIDNNDDRHYDVIIIKEIEYGIIGSINVLEEKIYDKYKSNAMLSLGDGSVSYFVSDIDGTALKLEDLEANTTIGYVKSLDSKLVEIVRYSKKVGGTYEMSTSEGMIVVKNKEYELSDYFKTNVKTLSSLKLGTEVILSLGDGNQVIYVEEYITSLGYAFVVDSGEVSGLEGVAMVKLFTDAGNMEELKVAQKLRINGNVVTSVSTAKAQLDAIVASEYSMRVIKYAKNVDGEVSKIFTAVNDIGNTNALMTQTVTGDRPVIYYDALTLSDGGLINDTDEIVYKETSAKRPFYSRGAFTPYFHLGSGAKIMQIPLRPSQFADEDNFSVRTSLSDNYYRPVAYDVTLGGKAGFVLIAADAAGGNISKYTSSAIIESITKGINEDGEETTIIKIFHGGAWDKYYYTDKTKLTAEPNGGDFESNPQGDTSITLTIDDFGPGDIIRFTADNKMMITQMTMNFDASAKSIPAKIAQSTSNNNGKYVEFIAGYALSRSGNSAMLATKKTLAEIDAVNGVMDIANTFSGTFSRGTTVFVRINRDRSTGKTISAEVFNEADLGNMETYFNSGINADYVVLRQYFRDPSLNVIYVNIDG